MQAARLSRREAVWVMGAQLLGSSPHCRLECQPCTPEAKFYDSFCTVTWMFSFQTLKNQFNEVARRGGFLNKKLERKLKDIEWTPGGTPRPLDRLTRPPRPPLSWTLGSAGGMEVERRRPRSGRRGSHAMARVTLGWP